MNYAAIKKQLADLEKELSPRPVLITVEIDGQRVDKSPLEWWEHREEWKLADFDRQNVNGGLVVLLVLALLADEAREKAEAENNPAEVERLTKEREEMLNLYFRG